MTRGGWKEMPMAMTEREKQEARQAMARPGYGGPFHEHDGYVPHSHEVRADHRGVEREPRPGCDPAPSPAPPDPGGTQARVYRAAVLAAAARFDEDVAAAAAARERLAKKNEGKAAFMNMSELVTKWRVIADTMPETDDASRADAIRCAVERELAQGMAARTWEEIKGKTLSSLLSENTDALFDDLFEMVDDFEEREAEIIEHLRMIKVGSELLGVDYLSPARWRPTRPPPG